MAANNFWANAAMEPKRAFKFILQLSPIESYLIKKVNRPSFDIGESEHKFINHTFYYPGRVTWNEITFSLVDAVLPDSTGILMKMLMASGYRFPTNANVTRSISKAEATAAVGNCMIRVIGSGNIASDPDGTAAEDVERWSLKNPWVKSVSMGDLDYEDDGIISMDVTLRYDWATLTIPKLNNQLDPTKNVGAVSPVGGIDKDKRLQTNNFAIDKISDDAISG